MDSINDTPRGDRLHISIFGRRNAGKSSLINAITHQKVAVVSEIPGTTTDPVYKSMEVLPLGPVVFIDTPGIDDVGMLGELRVEKTKEVLRKTDIGILVTTADCPWGEPEGELLLQLKNRNIPVIIALNKCEQINSIDDNYFDEMNSNEMDKHRINNKETGINGASTGGADNCTMNMIDRLAEYLDMDDDNDDEAKRRLYDEDPCVFYRQFINSKIRIDVPVVKTSALTGEGIEDLISKLAEIKKADDQKMHLVDGLIEPGDLALLVVPVDKAAPKGRLILPQQQVLRDILDNSAMALVVKDTELEQALKKLKCKPDIVITDSQVFDKADAIVPKDIPLTSFSIIYARSKGDLNRFLEAVNFIKELRDGDNILIAEGCTHHRKDDDIGTVKIPNLLKKKTGKFLNFHYVSGGFFEKDLSQYKMVIHCGACMLNKKEMEYRQEFSQNNGVPMINYGIILAYLHGILDRAIKPFKKELNGGYQK